MSPIKKPLFGLLLILISNQASSQFLMDMVDTSKDVGKGLFSLYQKFDHIRIGGYIQAQYQYASEKGVKNFSGGDFGANVDNRFLLRRGRIRFDYVHFNPKNATSAQFVFQFDGTERGVVIRDFWGRLFENRWKIFSISTGMFARPFGYELNLSSSDRESPERGRMSQLLMKTERDMGVMLSFEPREKNHLLHNIKWDLGFFNGQGLAATADFDSKKDLITRISLKPVKLSTHLFFSGSLSYLNGGLIQNTKYVNRIESSSIKHFSLDSSLVNQGQIAPRKYYGADLQLKFATKAGFTELRAEGIKGIQTATASSNETPAVLLTGKDAYFIRNFNGAYLYLLHNIFNPNHQLVVKYDWLDPNERVSKNEINSQGGFSNADIKYSTLGFGYNYTISSNVRLMLWYDRVWNESTGLSDYSEDISDNVFTARIQYRF